MLREIIRFEWRYHTRQIAFPAGALIFLALGFTLPVLGYGPGATKLNSPFVVMQSVGLISLLTIFVLTVFCANAVSRDAEHGMKEIVYATSVGKLRYLAARFVGSLAAGTMVFFCTILGMFLSPLLAQLDPDKLGPTYPLAYVWAFVVMALPNLLFVAAVVFAVAVLTRSVLASYVASVFLYMAYMVVSMMIDSPLMAGASPQTPSAMARAAILDPFGISAFFQQTWYWTPIQRNAQLLALDGYFLANRLLWIAVSLAILAATYRLFSFRVSAGARAAAPEADEPRPGGERYRPVAVAPEGWRARWGSLRVATLREFRTTAGSKPFIALMVLWVSVVGIDVVDNWAEYRTRMYPTTAEMLSDIDLTLTFLGMMMLVYFAAEVVWRERIVRTDEIIDATPTPSGVFYLAKGCALVLLTWVMAVLPMVMAIGYQVATGNAELVRPGAYLALFYFVGAPLALFVVVILLVQTLTPNRYLGIVIALFLALLAQNPRDLGLDHGLLRFGRPPRAPFTEMNGFIGSATFGWYLLYWAGLAGAIGFVTVGLWRRGVARTLLGRTRALPRAMGRGGLAGMAVSLAIFLCTGGFVFYHTNVLNRYETREQRLDRRAGYERSYRRFENAPQPRVVSVTTSVALYPSRRQFAVEGTYLLQNRDARPVDTVMVGLRRELRVARMELEGARLLRHDAPNGTYLFVMTRPMLPGATTRLHFRTASPDRTVEADDINSWVVANGSYLTRPAAFPRLGYVVGYELEDPGDRRERGLPPPRQGQGLMNDPARLDHRDGWLTVDATVSTEADQVAIGPGDLVREWRQGTRRYFRYRTAQPATPMFGFVSGRYQVRRVNHHGVSVEVYHVPSHAYNVDRMLAVATRSLDMFGERFGRYPHRHLRIAELPAYWEFGAYALPGVIVWPEDRGFLTDETHPAEVDLITRRAAHEISHQWWGHQVFPAQVPGGTMLVETLAKYSEMRVLAATNGAGSMLPLLRYEREQYLLGRTYLPFPEPSISRVVDLDHVYYAKGAIVFEALVDLIGEQAVSRALRRLVREHGPNDRPAVAADLLAALHAESPPEAHRLIDEWVDQVTFYDFRVESVAAQRLPDGRYRVTATVRAGKKVLPGGRAEAERDAPLDEMIDVAVYAGHPMSSDAAPVYAGKHRLRTGENRITFVVSGRPGFISLDAFERRIEEERADNVREVVLR